MTIIRPAAGRDAAAIARIYVDAWRSSYAAILPHRVLIGMSCERQAREWSWVIGNRAEAQPVIVAAEADGGVVGFASFGAARPAGRPASRDFDGDRDAKVGEAYTLYVQPEFQERGIGRRLLAAAFAAMAGRGYGRGFLWVLRDNPARYFYERVGGVMVAERQEQLWGCAVEQICYGWPDLARAIGPAARARSASRNRPLR
jgi:GNAT superfamily N-acetyltransferase